MGSRIQTFRRKIALGEYEVTGHAWDEMEQEGFSVSDVKRAIYGGRIAATQSNRHGQRKYVVEGPAVDGRKMRVVCRLTGLRRLRIITVFEVWS